MGHKKELCREDEKETFQGGGDFVDRKIRTFSAGKNPFLNYHRYFKIISRQLQYKS